ncbi:uncharacterized protein [Temnothorax longispinosus]|uniref:uncharacterized protein n=1 Tax=Temnothorax longispinosus TaxID=300112 RepID=UPI003A99EBE0
MSNVLSFCVFCHKKSGKLKCFNEDTLSKCLTVLKIRQEHHLHSADVVLPAKVDNYQKYHSNCYARFTALPPKQRGYDPNKQASSSSERDQNDSAIQEEVAVQGEDVDRGEFSAESEDAVQSMVSDKGEGIDQGEDHAPGDDVSRSEDCDDVGAAGSADANVDKNKDSKHI